MPFLAVIIVVMALLGPGWLGLEWAWLIVGILMLVFVGLIGVSLGKDFGGVFIDPTRNAMSLSRLQVVLWTVVILSAFMTVALGRVWDSRDNADAYVYEPAEITGEETEQEPECADPLGVQLPPLLWAMMGISVTSAVGAPLLKTAKAQRTAGADQVQQRDAGKQAVTYSNVLKQRKKYDPAISMAAPANAPAGVGTGESLSNTGALVKKGSWTEAMFSDVFTGEETSNFGYVDVAKVQNFFFTMITIVAYSVTLWVAMSTAPSIADFFTFPDLPQGLMAVISISHAGYLTDKAFTHTTPKPPPEP